MERELPILFNTDMVCAILRNPPENKTVTRRAIKGYIPDDARFGYTAFTPKGHISCRGTFKNGYGEKFFKLPYQKGDILYVRETWSYDVGGIYIYKASYTETFTESKEINAVGNKIKWNPSIHMPKEAARIWLRVAEVTAERLQDMTIDDFLDEGVVLRPEAFNDPENAHLQARNIFRGIWDSTIPKSKLPEYGWDANPWVLATEFEQCDKPAAGKEAGSRETDDAF